MIGRDYWKMSDEKIAELGKRFKIDYHEWYSDTKGTRAVPADQRARIINGLVARDSALQNRWLSFAALGISLVSLVVSILK